MKEKISMFCHVEPEQVSTNSMSLEFASDCLKLDCDKLYEACGYLVIRDG